MKRALSNKADARRQRAQLPFRIAAARLLQRLPVSGFDGGLRIDTGWVGLHRLPTKSEMLNVLIPAFLAVVSAALMAVAVASPGHFWLGWITLIPLLFAVRALSPIAAVLFGALWGTSLFAFGAYVFPTLMMPTLGTWALLAAVPALYALFGVRVTRRVGFSPLLLALGWVGVELALRPIGLRHGLLAATQGDGLVLRLIGSYVGYALVAFFVVYVNAWLLTLLARVQLKLPGRGLLRVIGTKPAIRLSLIETPNYWFLLLRPSKPRAPPHLAL